MRLDLIAGQCRQDVVEKLKLRPRTSDEFTALIAEAFDAFDVDRSGELDLDETQARCHLPPSLALPRASLTVARPSSISRRDTQELMHAAFHDVEGAAFSEIMLDVRKFTNANGDITLASLHDAMFIIMRNLGRPMQSEMRSPTRMRLRPLDDALKLDRFLETSRKFIRESTSRRRKGLRPANVLGGTTGVSSACPVVTVSSTEESAESDA